MKKNLLKVISGLLSISIVLPFYFNNTETYINADSIDFANEINQEAYDDESISFKNINEDNEQGYNENQLIPTTEQINQWEEDGSFQKRIDYYISLGSTNVSPKLISKNNKNNQINTFSLAPDYPTAWVGGMPTEGDVKTLVFMVDFPDMPNTNQALTPDSVKDSLFGNEDISNVNYPYESLYAYYKRSSYGKLNISGDVIDWYTAEHERDYYTNMPGSLVSEILEYYDNEIDYSDYDSDGDNIIDGIYIYFSGVNTGWGTTWWSAVHTNYLLDVPDDMYITKFALLHSISANTLIHETGHLLGLPDYYDYEDTFNWNGEAGGLGYFDMMDHNTGDHNIFSKMLLGWVEPVFITQDEIINLSLSTDEAAQCVIVTPDKSKNIFSEYYVLEYYNNDLNNYDSATCSGAIKIYHVNAELDESGWDFKYNNSDTEFKLIKLLEADGSEDNGTYARPIYDAKYYKENMTFGINTMPSSEFYNKVFTGININVNKINEDKANVSINFYEEDTISPCFSDNIICQNSIGNYQTVNAKIYFDTYIYNGININSVTLKNKKTNEDIEITAKIMSVRLRYEAISNYNVFMVRSNVFLDCDNEYILYFPDDAVVDCYGNGNKAFYITFKTANNYNEGQIKDYKLDVLPENTPDGYVFFNANKTITLNLSDGKTAFFRQIISSYYTHTPDYRIAYTLIDKDGSIIVNTAINPQILYYNYNEFGYIRTSYELDNNKILISLANKYLMIDFEGNVISYEYYTGIENLNPEFFNWSSFFNTPYRYNDEYFEYISRLNTAFKNIICRIYKTGEIKRFIIDFYDANQIGARDLRYFDENFNLNEELLSKDKNEKNKQYVIFNKANKTIHMSEDIFATYEGYFGELNDSYSISNIEDEMLINVSTFYSDNSGFTKTGNSDCYLICIDESGRKKLDIKIFEQLPSNSGMNVLPLDGDGYLAKAPIIKYSTLTCSTEEDAYQIIGALFIRLDNDFNILWQSRVLGATEPGMSSAILKDSIITVVQGYGVYEFNDINDGILISSEKEFFFNDNTAYTINDNIINTNFDLTAQEWIDSITGEYKKITIYDENCSIVSDMSKIISDGLLCVESMNGIYKYYYTITSESDTEIIYGDVNNDGEVDNLDVTILKRYLAKWDGVEINENAADVNNDEEIDNLDITLLKRYLADWDVTLGK